MVKDLWRKAASQGVFTGQCNMASTTRQHCKTAAAVSIPLLRTEWRFCCAAFQWAFQCFSKIALFRGGISTPFNTWFLWKWGPHESVLQTASRSVQPFLQDSPVCPTDRQTDKQTDRSRYVRHLCQQAASMQCMRCGLILRNSGS